jgi:hypothetical protein
MHAAADLPRRHRLTVADYYRMAEVGIVDPEARVELGSYTLVDEPDLDTALEVSALSGIAVDLNRLFG